MHRAISCGAALRPTRSFARDLEQHALLWLLFAGLHRVRWLLQQCLRIGYARACTLRRARSLRDEHVLLLIASGRRRRLPLLLLRRKVTISTSRVLLLAN